MPVTPRHNGGGNLARKRTLMNLTGEGRLLISQKKNTCQQKRVKHGGKWNKLPSNAKGEKRLKQKRIKKKHPTSCSPARNTPNPTKNPGSGGLGQRNRKREAQGVENHDFGW